MSVTLNHDRLLFLVAVLLVLAVGNSQDFIRSRATYFGSPDCKGNPGGACGYGEYGRDVNDGLVAAVHRPYRNGTGCGGCYQVRCKRGECTDDGVVVVATDFGVGDRTDFIFPSRAYLEMARPGYQAELLSYGIVDVEFRRVPCTFAGPSLIFKIHEGSKFPNYLAIIITYPLDVYDVVGVQIRQENSNIWRPMRKPYGAVWDKENPPTGNLKFSFLLSASGRVDEAKWVESPTQVPAYWQAGATFEAAIRL